MKRICQNKSFMTKKQAFTLIELLIVIAIIGILFIVLVSKVDFATDKAKATGVQTDFRSFQMAFDTVAKENAGFNTFGWDTGDANQDGIRNSYDEGDTNKDGIQNGIEVFTGHKVYDETFTQIFSFKKNGTGSYDRDALNRLETAINANLDPKLHITIKDDGEIVMANGAKDPWNKEYHGWYITNAEADGKDRGAIVMYSDGANNEFGSEHKIANGVVSISISGNNKAGKDDYSIVSLYTYVNGYGEVKNITSGFSNNQTMLGDSGIEDNNNTPILPDDPDTPNNSETPDNLYENLEAGLYETGSNYQNQLYSWQELKDEGILNVFGTYVLDYDRLQGDLVLPREMDSVPWDAFKNSKITSIVFPEVTSEIGTDVVSGCTNLSEIILWPTAKIGYASNLSSFKTIRFMGTMKEWCNIERGEWLSTCDEIYINGELITDIKFDSSVTNIKSNAFYGYRGLKSVEIPEHVIVGRSVFRNSSVESVIINAELNNECIFYDCKNLKNVTINKSSTEQLVFASCTAIENLYVGKDVRQFGYWAFFNDWQATNVYFNGTVEDWCEFIVESDMYSLPFLNANSKFYIQGELVEHLVIPSGVTKINNYVFSEYGGLKSVTIPSTVESIGIGAFYQCANLTTVNLSEGIKSVGSKAFMDCKKVTTISIPNSLESIDSGAFFNMISVQGTLQLGNNLKTIGKEAFYNWRVKSIIISDSVESIGERAFNNCISATTLVIGRNVKTLGAEAFLDMKSLQTVTIYAATPPECTTPLRGYDVNDLHTIFVPSGSKSAYESHASWSEYNTDTLKFEELS